MNNPRRENVIIFRTENVRIWKRKNYEFETEVNCKFPHYF